MPPRLPIELAQEIENDELTLTGAAYQRGQTDMVRRRGILHWFMLPMISPSNPSVSFSSAKMSARISSSVRSGCGL